MSYVCYIYIHSIWLDQLEEKDQPMRIGITLKTDLTMYNENNNIGITNEIVTHVNNYILVQFQEATTNNNNNNIQPPKLATCENLHYSNNVEEKVSIWCWSYKLRKLVRDAVKNFIIEKRKNNSSNNSNNKNNHNNNNINNVNRNNTEDIQYKLFDSPLPIFNLLEKYYKFHLQRIQRFAEGDWWTHIEQVLGQQKWNRCLPYQKYSIAMGIFNNGNLLLGDDMGLGKTYQLLCISHYFIQRNLSETILIICPASVRSGWQEEIIAREFIPRNNNGNSNIGNSTINSEEYILLCEGGNKLSQLSWLDILKYRYVIISFALLETLNSKFNQYKSTLMNGESVKSFNIVIIDESQNIMNEDTQRIQLLQPILQHSQRRLLSSGTPLNKTKQLFNQWTSIHPTIFSNFYEFGRRYCDPKEKYIPGKGSMMFYDGYSNLEELYALLRMSVFIRRTKDQVLSLPGKHRTCIYLDNILPPKKNKTTNENLNEDDNEDKSEENQQLQAMTPAEKTIFRELMDNARRKLSSIVKHLDQWWNTKGQTFAQDDKHNKVILFATHKVVFNALEKLASGWKFHNQSIQHIRITGGTPAAHRPFMIHQFQNNILCRVAIISIRSGGCGLNLQASNHIFFTEIDFSYVFNIQAEDRSYRLGQTLPVYIQYLLIKEPLEERLWNNVTTQSQQTSILLNGQSLEARTTNTSSQIIPHSILTALPVKNEKRKLSYVDQDENLKKKNNNNKKRKK